MKKRFFTFIIAILLMVCLLPEGAFATNYSNTHITDMQFNGDGKITSITVSFKTTSTYSSNWFLAINDYTTVNETNAAADYYDDNGRFYIPSENIQATGISGMSSAGMTALAYGAESSSGDGTHTMVLTPTAPIEKNSNYKLNLWIYINAAWNNYGKGYYIDQTWDLSEQITVYEQNYTTMLNAGTGMSFQGEGTQSVTKGQPIADIIINASNGYYFPDGYTWSSNGLNATRLSDSQIQVSGTPTANFEATLPNATAKTRLTGLSLKTNPDPLKTGVLLTAENLTPAGATATYQWYRVNPSYSWSTRSIAGATGSTYTTVDADIGYKIMAEASGTGLYTGSANASTSNMVTGTLTGVTLSTETPKVTTQITASISPAAATVTYQWYTNTTNAPTGGTAIDGASASTYTPVDADVGKYLYCVVNGTSNYSGTASAITTDPVSYITHTVVFSSDGGSVVASKTAVINGSTIAAPDPAPTKEKYDFAGWYKDTELTNPWNFETDTVLDNITLYAKWTLTPISVNISSLAANGSETEKTTALTLTFDKDIEGFSADNITVTGATKGALTKASGSGVYTLAISDITVGDNGMVNVAVAKDNFIFSPVNKDVAVHFPATVTPATAVFDRYDTSLPTPVFTLEPSGHTLTALKYNGQSLNENTDYTRSGNIFTINRSWLNVQTLGDVTLTFDMDSGADLSVVITTWDSSLPTVSSVTLTPSATSVVKGRSKTFTVTVSGTNDPAQTAIWSVSGNSSTSTAINNGVLIVDGSETATTLTVKAVSTVDTTKFATATVTVAEPTQYQIILGQNGSWLKGSTGGLSFTADAEHSKFTGVSVDGAPISGDYYTSQSGSTVITLKPAYLETLSVGWHKLQVDFTDGYAGTNFYVYNKWTVPPMGDSAESTLWLSAFIMAGAGLALLFALRHKRKMG